MDEFGAEYDLIVLGSGAAGLTAALTAAIEGAKPLLVESTAYLGGTSARSSGTVWIPDNPDMRRCGNTGDAALATTYLDALAGDKAERTLRLAFIAAGREMIEYLERHTDFAFRQYREHPDYRQDLPGAAMGGRPLEPPEFDGRLLGGEFARVAWPLRELMLFGGMMLTRGEAAQLLTAYKSPTAALLGVKMLARYAADRLFHARGTRLVLGNALVARLYKHLLERKVELWFSATTDRLVVESGRVVGTLMRRGEKQIRVAARCGVVLAGGGFPASAELRDKYFRAPVAQYTPAYEGCIGGTLRMGLEAGGTLGAPGEDNALWFPSSVAERADGSTAVYPHIVLDRAKPGLVAVGRNGLRFTNEGASYHEFTRGMYRANASAPCIPAWLVCDRRFLWKYGLGMIRPLTARLAPYIERGYLREAASIAGLARAIGVDSAGLAETVRRHAEFARTGVDADFCKGGNAYDRGNGDPVQRPNPCLGAIEKPPFYAVEIWPTPLGTSLGLRTDAQARVCDADGKAIPGLYAAGSDMHSITGGEYPGAGAQLGPAMTFGYVAALDALGRRATGEPAREC